jgi:hypothetical protein
VVPDLYGLACPGADIAVHEAVIPEVLADAVPGRGIVPTVKVCIRTVQDVAEA